MIIGIHPTPLNGMKGFRHRRSCIVVHYLKGYLFPTLERDAQQFMNCLCQGLNNIVPSKDTNECHTCISASPVMVDISEWLMATHKEMFYYAQKIYIYIYLSMTTLILCHNIGIMEVKYIWGQWFDANFFLLFTKIVTLGKEYIRSRYICFT